MGLRKFWLEHLSPVTYYYKYVQFLYSKGVRPKPGSLFYADVLHKEAQFMGRNFR